MSHKSVTLRSAFLLLFGVSVISWNCNSAFAEAYVASDGQSSVELPIGWGKFTGLNDKAEIEIGASRADQYLVVLTERKDDFVDMNLDQFSQVTVKSIVDSLKEVKVSEPKKIQVDGKPAVQREVIGALDNLKIGYLHTSIEGTKNFYQVLAWARKSSFEGDARKVLDEAISSFKEIVK